MSGGGQIGLFDEAPPVPPPAHSAHVSNPAAAADRLAAWAPRDWPVADDWRALVDVFFDGPTGRALGQALQARLAAGAVVYPPRPLRALELTPLAQARVVILGQDPYHGPGQAEGLAFSVAPGVRLPPSLRNIFKEIAREAGRPFAPPASGSLAEWARQGVLLLNTCLTVERGEAGSHAKLGWEALTDAIVAALAQDGRPKVFMLWGAHAQSKAGMIDAGRHLVLQSNHPSPLSATRGPVPFIGNGHFGAANRYLAERGETPICWR